MRRHSKTTDTANSSDTSLTRRKSVRLSDALVRGLQKPATGNRVTFDERVAGFGVRITTKGHVAFVQNYTFEGRERRITIGSHPTWSVAAARKRAAEIKLQVASGIDPLEDRTRSRNAPTVQDMYERYAKNYMPRLAPRSAQDQNSMFAKSILPALGKKKVKDVSFSDCEALHRHITKHRPLRANRVIEVLRRAFNLAIKWGWLERNPASGIEKNPETKRERYLSPNEIARLITELDRHPQKTSCDAIRFILFTGCRRGEALNARWDQFNSDLNVWTKPAATTKQRRLHRVPVSLEVTNLLSSRKNRSSSPFVFSSSGDRPLTDIKKTWASVTNAANIENARIHDLRHTFASIAVSNGQSLAIIGAMLGHTQHQTTMRYAHLYDTTLADAANAVSKAITSPTG